MKSPGPGKDMYDCLLRCKQGDLESFRQLVDHYGRYAQVLALRLLGNEEDARDAVHESFIRVWKHIDRFDMNSKFTTWMYRIVTNLCLDILKARKREARVILKNPTSGELERSQEGSDLETSFIEKDLAAQIATLAEELSPNQKAVFVLRDIQDLDIKEVARVTGMSPGSVKSNLYYARKNIRLRLRQMGHEGGKQNGM